MANEISKIYNDIEELLKVARSKAYHAINSIMVETYWKIGQRIVEEEQAEPPVRHGASKNIVYARRIHPRLRYDPNEPAFGILPLYGKKASGSPRTLVFGIPRRRLGKGFTENIQQNAMPNRTYCL